MKTASIELLLTLVIVLVISGGCKPENQVPSKTIKIGVLLGFTGTGSQNAIETKAALDIGLQDANDYILRNGIDATVELYFEDTKSDTTEAKVKAQLLIDKGVSLIIGPYTSAEARAVKAIADAKNILLVTHSAVSTSLAIAGDNLLRFAPSDSYQAEALNAMLTADTIKAIIPVVRNDLWSNSLIAATTSGFELNGGTVISKQTFEPGTVDFSTIIAAVKSGLDQGEQRYGAGRTAIYLISYGDGTGFIEALSQSGLTKAVRIYGASAFAQSTLLTANAAAAGFAQKCLLQCPVFGFDEAASNIYEPLQARITGTIGYNASIYALAAYDILRTAVIARLTQESDPEFATFKAHFIETAASYYGATGRTELNEYGDRKHVTYDFWTVNYANSKYIWQLSAKYNTTDQTLRRIRLTSGGL
jgi:branched-chain amino acid transport system substrate-binding protein